MYAFYSKNAVLIYHSKDTQKKVTKRILFHSCRFLYFVTWFTIKFQIDSNKLRNNEIRRAFGTSTFHKIILYNLVEGSEIFQ